jgi:hypothetical protein
MAYFTDTSRFTLACQEKIDFFKIKEFKIDAITWFVAFCISKHTYVFFLYNYKASLKIAEIDIRPASKNSNVRRCRWNVHITGS